ncbi:MAG: PQQ-dependent sugar dehydrogenase, partial [Myxococcales bacterium]
MFALVLGFVSPARAQTFSVPNFSRDIVYSGVGMISVQFGPGGRLYVAEKRGRVLVMHRTPQGNYGAATVFADLRSFVNPAQESGLLGMALDPDFATNRHMYLFYTTSTDQRLVRVTADATYDAMTGPQTVLLSGLPRAVAFHKAGDIQFHPQEPDHLYIALGDDNDPASAQTVTSYVGKMLRVNKADGRGLASNPYYQAGDSLDSVRARVWAIGFRNPFRFTFHPATPHPDVMYVSENGNSSDRISRVRAGSNGAWNTQGDNGGFLNPPDPNHKVLAATPPVLLGIAMVRGGPFADPAHPGSDVMYVANWMGNTIRRYRLTGADLDTLAPVAADNGNAFVTGIPGMHLLFGPDGALYATWSQGDASESGTHFTLSRIRFTGGIPPVASFTTSPAPAVGPAPFPVTFTDTSTDDGQIVSRAWNFGDGNTSSQANPTHTFQNPGDYLVRLTVTDNVGLTHATTRTVTATRALNLRVTGTIHDARTLAAPPASSAVELRFYQRDGTTPLAFPTGTGPARNVLTVANGTVDRVVQVDLNDDGFVISAGEGHATYQPAFAAFAVSAQATQHTQPVAFHLSDTAFRGRVRSTRGQPVSTDIGVAMGSPGARYAIAGGRDYQAPVPASGVAHRIVSDVSGRYYVPLRTGDTGTFHFDLVADTGTSTWLPRTDSASIAAGALVERDFTVGLLQGGETCDDVRAIPETPDVEYATQIHPLWLGACTGCHNGQSSASGGLLLDGDSYAALVGVDSLLVPGRKLVEPGSVEASFLFEKINCASPQSGTRMRPTDAMPLAEQALVAAWIRQGAKRTTVIPDAGIVPDAGIETDAGTDPGSDAGLVLDGGVDASDKASHGYVWPVRAGSGLFGNSDISANPT